MSIFEVLNLIGGLCLFLFGMNIMSEALEKRAGNSLRNILSKMTTNKFTGLLTGLGVTAIIQSSSATTVMVVGFVNSGLMNLRQAINVIMGANIGTTVTSWILSLGGIDSSNVWVKLLKPTSFTPVLALIGIIFYMLSKDDRKKDTGMILLGFAVLMFGMESMSNAVSGLKNVPSFQNLFLLFTNPILGVLAGAILTAIIQSSSASVGILQALSTTGSITVGAAIPIIMGQNIGTCVTAMLSSIGTTRNAKRTAVVHLMFNIIGTVVCLTVYMIISSIISIPLLSTAVNTFQIAIIHSIFNIICTVLLFPASGLLEKIVVKMIPENNTENGEVELDERLLNTPTIAIMQASSLTNKMAQETVENIHNALELLKEYQSDQVKLVKDKEEEIDHYEDLIGSYLLKIYTKEISKEDSIECSKLFRALSDFERIGDHAYNIAENLKKMNKRHLVFSNEAMEELYTYKEAVLECLTLTLDAFINNDAENAVNIEPLENVIDHLNYLLQQNHIDRLKRNVCSVEVEFAWNTLIDELERVADHCSNIAAMLIDVQNEKLNLHEVVKEIKNDSDNYRRKFEEYNARYTIKAMI